MRKIYTLILIINMLSLFVNAQESQASFSFSSEGDKLKLGLFSMALPSVLDIEPALPNGSTSFTIFEAFYNSDDSTGGLSITPGIKYKVSGNFSELDLRENDLTELEIINLHSIKSLNCAYNNLKKLDIKNLENLENLFCDFNELQELDFESNTSLTEISCVGNDLQNIDLTDLSNLKLLYCEKNKLKNINVSGLVNLEKLDCSANMLKSVDLSGLSNLRYFYFFDNEFSVCGMDSIYNSLLPIEDGSVARLYVTNNNSQSEKVSKSRTYIAKDKKWNVLDYKNGNNPTPFESSGDYECPDTWINEFMIGSGLNIAIFPNPVQDDLQIFSEDIIKNVLVYDIIGKLLIKEEINDSSFNLPTIELNKGTYILKVQTEKGQKNFKILKD